MFLFILRELEIAFLVAPKAGSRTTLSHIFKLDTVLARKTFIYDIKGAERHKLDWKSYKVVLIYREPLERFVSGYFMPEVSDDTTFEEFVNRYDSTTAKFHQQLQFDSKMIDGANIVATMETKDLDNLPKLITELTGDKCSRTWLRTGARNVRQPAPDKATKLDKPWTLPKATLKENLPRWEDLYNDELRAKATKYLEKDIRIYFKLKENIKKRKFE